MDDVQRRAPAGRGLAFQLVHNPRLVYTSFFLAMVFFTFGYDGSVMSGVLAMAPFINQYGSVHGADGTSMSATDIGIVTALPSAGCVVGLPLAVYVGDRFGRKVTLILGCIFSAVGAALQTSAYSEAQFVVGRLLSFSAIFIFIVMASTFLAEIAPEQYRGAIVGLSIVLVDTAAVMASGINWGLSSSTTELSFRLPIGLQILFPAAIGLALLFVDDSPTFYLTKSQDDKALQSLRKVRRGYTEAEITGEFAALKAQAELRREEVEVPWTHIFKGADLRRTLLALSIGNMQQLSGIVFATNYATIFLQTIGSDVSAFLLTLIISILALSGAVTGLFLVDSVGRRPLALTTFVILFAIDLIVGVLGFTDYMHNANLSRAIAAFCCMFSFFFAAGFGPLTYVIASEVPTARLRNTTSAFSFFVLACFQTLVIYVMPYIANADAANLGPKTYLIFAGWMFFCVVTTFLYLPETKGRSPAELDAMFAAKVPARQFKNYVCNINTESYMAEQKNQVQLMEAAV